MAHGGVPSHVSQDLMSLLSFVQPVHEVEARDAPFQGLCPHGKNNSGFSVLRFLSRYQVRMFFKNKRLYDLCGKRLFLAT